VSQRLKNYLKLLLKFIITVGALYFVYTRINISELLKVFEQSNLFILIAALILFTASKIISAYRLNIFFSSAGLELSSKYNLKLYLLGMYYNLFLPGGIGGDGYKIYLLNRETGVKVKKLFWATLIDRISGVLALTGLAAAFTIFMSVQLPLQRLYWLFIPVAYIIFYLIIHLYFQEFQKAIHKTNLQSLAVQITQTLCALIILYAAGINDHITEYLFVFLISSVVATLPFTIGGIGSRELTFLFGAQLLHLNINSSVALSLIFYIITALVSSTGIIYSFNPGRLNK